MSGELDTTPQEAELAALLESMAPNEAQSMLAELASALFPSGIGDLRQLSWEPTLSPPLPPMAEPLAHEPSPENARLQAAELRYRTLVEQIPAVTFMAVLGEGQNEVYVSPHIEALLGFTQKEWLDNPFLWYTQLHPDDRPLWHEEFARGCRTGGPFRAECRLLARDGHVVWVRGEARLIKDALGRPLFLQGVAFDITDSKRAQEVLLREAVQITELRYRDLVERLGAIFWEAEGSNGRFTFVSEGAERILGFPPERWLDDAQFWITRVHQEDRERVVDLWWTALAEGRDHEFEFRALTADNRVVWLQNRVHFSGAGVAQARPLGVILDISERKRSEDELGRGLTREQAARAEAEALNLLGRSLAAELDLEQLVRLIADAGAELTGAEWAAFVRVMDRGGSEGTYVRSSKGKHRNSAGFASDDPLLAPTFAGSTLLVEDLHSDPEILLRSAVTREFALRSFLGIPVISRTGDVLGGLFFGHAAPTRFTKRHERLIEGFAAQAAIAVDNARLYDAAESARKAAETANRMKDDFLATMSHELRTPLHAVLGWTHVLQAGGEHDATRERGLAAIERNARAQAQIIEDLLDVSRIVTGKLHLDMTRVDLTTVIEGAHETVKFAADAKNIELTTDLAPTATVIGDTVRLRQVVSNLMANAVKFTPDGGRIEITLQTVDDKARIRVADNGQGIDASFLPHVFERFRQADGSTTRAHGGLGLGLAIVRHLTELHGGRVHAESPGRGLGATFTVELPLDVAHAGEDAAGGQGNEERATQLRAVLKGARILVVDDEPDSRDLIASMFLGPGARVSTASSVDEAIRTLAVNPADLLICDIGMPYEDGYALMRRLQTLGGAYERMPAVAVTAYASAEDRQRAMAAGFMAHLGKPIEADQLLSVAARLLSNKSER